MTVYIHRNKNNGKRYVGITETDPAKRWLGGAGYHRNKHFYDAIKLYGWDAFEHEIVAVDLTRDEAQKMERELIAKYKTQDKRYGYNITDGGEHFRHSDASKVLMSRNRKGKGLKEFTPEHIQKMRDNHAGGADARSVVCIETGEIFKSINEAARDKGINKKGISGCCRNVLHYNTAGGLHWSFAE